MDNVRFMASQSWAVDIFLFPDQLAEIAGDSVVADDVVAWISYDVGAIDADTVVTVPDGGLNSFVTVRPILDGENVLTGVKGEIDTEAVLAAWKSAGSPPVWSVVDDPAVLQAV